MVIYGPSGATVIMVICTPSRTRVNMVYIVSAISYVLIRIICDVVVTNVAPDKTCICIKSAWLHIELRQQDNQNTLDKIIQTVKKKQFPQ